jgi:DNA-binding MarR family transcriptional regulator
MITRDPDVTRLLDRMEKRKLISRCRDKRDRRVVYARISASGEKILAQLDPVVIDAHRKQLGHLTPDQLKLFIELLELARKRSNAS